MRKDLDSGVLDSDDPGGRGGVPSVGEEVRVIGWADQAEDEDTEDVEEEDTDPNTANGHGDVLGRIVGLSGSHSEDLCPQESVGGTD